MERARLEHFVESLPCVERRGGWRFLRDPHWSEADQQAAAELFAIADRQPAPADGWLCIRTGGSDGGMKFARHDERTLAAAVDGFCRHFGLQTVHAVGVLPAWHISGFMARLRSFATGGQYVGLEWKRLEAGELPALDERPWVVSLVPTQLHRLLNSGAATIWLRKFGVVLIGGGPMWADLAEQAARAGIRMALSYGMTESAAMVTAQQPAEFLAGDRSCGRAMPHATLSIDEQQRIRVASAALFRGYFPHGRSESEFRTQDLGRLDAAGRLFVTGRADAAIITGGKKVHPNEVEATLRATGEFDDVAVIGVPDAEWGEIVVACYPASPRLPNFERAARALAAHERPKRWVPISPWPRNAQGKINRAALLQGLTA
jgi:O-succinylbenzoic acid--CoA ligase